MYKRHLYADGLEHAIYIEVFDDGTTNLWVDGEQVATGNSAGSTNTTQNIYIGSLGAFGSFTKQCRLVELYDRPATEAERTAIFTNRSIRDKNWYKGRVVESKKELSHIKLVAHDAMKQLVDTEGKGQFYSGALDGIVNSLINYHTDLSYNDSSTPTTQSTRLVFIGKLMDVVNRFFNQIGKIWSVDADDNFKVRRGDTDTFVKTYTHGVNSSISAEEDDDARIVNEYAVAFGGVSGNFSNQFPFGSGGGTYREIFIPEDADINWPGRQSNRRQTRTVRYTYRTEGRFTAPGQITGFTVGGVTLPTVSGTQQHATSGFDYSTWLTWNSHAYISGNTVVIMEGSDSSASLSGQTVRINYRGTGDAVLSFKDTDSQAQIGKRQKFTELDGSFSSHEGIQLAEGLGKA